MLKRFLQAHCLLIQVILPMCSTRNVGSVFYNQYRLPKFWDDTELARLRARRVFNSIIPQRATPNDINGQYVYDMLRYFRTALEQTDEDATQVLKEALADTIGGFLRAEMLPNARYAFYAGNIKYEDVQALSSLFSDIKEFLNTQGYGWRKPRKVRMNYNFNVQSVDIRPGAKNTCSKVIALRDDNDCIKIPMPKLDDNENPSAIAIPWRKNALIGLSSQKSSRILISFYKIAAECILTDSPLSCRNSAFLSFNRDLSNWMSEDVAHHLDDEKWYIGFGGVLQVGATVNGFCKTENENEVPFKPRDGSFEYIRSSDRQKDELLEKSNAMFLIQLVVALAVGTWIFLYLLSSFYRNRWRSKKTLENRDEDKEAMAMPGSGETSYRAEAERKNIRSHRSSSNLKSLSKVSSIPVGTDRVKCIVNTLQIPSKASVSMRTEKVFDLNDQKMKDMTVPVNSEVATTEPTEIQGRSSQVTRSTPGYSLKLTSCGRSTSPPRLETAMSQFQVKKTVRSGDDEMHLAVYSTSECTIASRSDLPSTKASESVSSYVSSSCTTGSSADSQGLRGPRRVVARISKDLAWAKRIATGHRRKKEERAPAKSSDASRTQKTHT